MTYDARRIGMVGTSARGQRPVTWDLMEEHLDEAAFLWNLWSRALVSPGYALDEVAEGPEERLLAHVDALVLGGPAVADRLLTPALAHEDPGVVFAAACALLARADKSGRRKVIDALANAGERVPLLQAALRLFPSPQTTEDLRAAWPALPDPARPAVMEAFMLTGTEPGRLLDEALNGRDSALASAALRAAHWVGRLTPDLVLFFVQSPDAALARHAMRTGLAAALAPVWARAVASTEPDALLWQALAGHPDQQDQLFAACADSTRRPYALWALGFAGRARGAELCLDLMDDAACARLAGEAFEAITGLAIAGPYARPMPPDDDESPAETVDPPGGRGETDLPMPARDAVAAWWARERGRFRPDTRYLGGAPLTADRAIRALKAGPMRRRGPIALELSARAGGTPAIARALDLDAWARTQREGLSAFSLPRPPSFDGPIGGRR